MFAGPFFVVECRGGKSNESEVVGVVSDHLVFLSKLTELLVSPWHSYGTK
jgi:hypothetical protein